MEKAPHKKHLVQDFTPLADSMLWTLLTNYYKRMALAAWSHNYVPMFVTSNSRLARSYARTFLNFLKDFYAAVPDAKRPVYILEIGAGHGRFTYLFLRHLLRTQPSWRACGLPETPFVYVCTDVAEANLTFCQNHQAFQQFIQDGWLDFALFDANCTESVESAQVHLRIANRLLPRNHPIALVANYVLDSLLTDGIQITMSDEHSDVRIPEYSRSLVAVHSPQLESDLSDPDIISRMSLSWRWAPFSTPDELSTMHAPPCVSSTDTASPRPLIVNDRLSTHPLSFMDPVAPEMYSHALATLYSKKKGHAGATRGCKKEEPLRLPCPEYVKSNSRVQEVLNAYAANVAKNGYPLSFVLPIGAFRLFEFLYEYSDGQLMCMIGDKGYHDASEFRGLARNPHIAIHGSISFMVNLHSIKLFFAAMNGFHVCTPYKDTFQITLGYAFRGLASSAVFGHSIQQLILDIEDFPPDSLLVWQHQCQDPVHKGTNGCTGIDNRSEHGGDVHIKTAIALIRYSAHDPEVFFNFRSIWTTQSAASFLGPRGESDLLRDLERVFENWYKLRENEDIPDLLAHVCMNICRLDRAIFFFKQSLKWCPESEHSATYVNMAACHKALGELEKAQDVLDMGLQHNPRFQPALELQLQLDMCKTKTRIAFVGGGHWTRTEVLPALLKDGRVVCAAFFAFQPATVEALKKIIAPFTSASDPFPHAFYTQASGFEQLLRDDNVEACILDVHARLILPLATRLWEAGKHVLVRSPFALTCQEAHETLRRFIDIQQRNFASLSSKNVKPGLPANNICRRSNLIAWHASCPFRYEEAFQKAAKLIKSQALGSPMSVTYRSLTDEGLSPNETGVVATYDDTDTLVIELLHGLIAFTVLLTGAKLKTVSASYAHGSCTRQLNDGISAPRLASWFDFVPDGSSFATADTTILGNAFCCRHAGDNLLEFVVICSQGTLKLERIGNSWKLTTSGPSESRQMGFVADGLTTSHDLWLKQIHGCLPPVTDSTTSTTHSSKESISLSDKNALSTTPQQIENQLTQQPQPQILLNTSLVSAVLDSVIVEAILASIQRGGSPMKFSSQNSAKLLDCEAGP